MKELQKWHAVVKVPRNIKRPGGYSVYHAGLCLNKIKSALLLSQYHLILVGSSKITKLMFTTP